MRIAVPACRAGPTRVARTGQRVDVPRLENESGRLPGREIDGGRREKASGENSWNSPLRGGEVMAPRSLDDYRGWDR